MTAGQINIVTSNGVCMITLLNVVCTPDAPIVAVGAFLGGAGKYFYDQDNSGMYIDDSRLFCQYAQAGYRNLTLVI